MPWPDPLSSIGGGEGEGCDVLGGGINDDVAALVIAPPASLVCAPLPREFAAIAGGGGAGGMGNGGAGLSVCVDLSFAC